jgi:AcrR family transcriptional regulator
MRRRPRTSPRRAPTQKRAEETNRILLDATEIVLARHGYEAATTNRIARAAGVSIGTLYHYFPSKEALIEAVVHRMWQSELAVLDAGEAKLHALPLEQAVREIVGSIVTLAAKRIEFYGRWYAEAPHIGQLEVGLEMAQRAIAIVERTLELRRDEVRPKNLPFASDLVIKTVLAVVRTAARDYAREVKSGELAQELSQMISRYLIKGS